MIKKEDLEELEALKIESKNLKERISKLENIPRKIVSDSVQGSSKSFPYIRHTCTIEGLDDSITYRKRKSNLNKRKKMLKDKERAIDKKINQIEYELNYVEEAEIREIIRLKYIDGLTWIQTMYKMNYNSEDTARKKLEKFLKKY